MKRKGPTRRELQGAETKKKLYASAGRLFTERDFDDVSVEEITDDAGVTKGTFYVHFESKDALIASYVAEYTAHIDLDYSAFLDALPQEISASGAMLALIGKISDTLTDIIGYDIMRRVYQLQLTKNVDLDAVKGYNRKLYKLFGSILERGIKQGEFQTELPIEVLTRYFVMAIRGISYEWCIRYPNFDLKKEATAYFVLLLQGIARS